MEWKLSSQKRHAMSNADEYLREAVNAAAALSEAASFNHPVATIEECANVSMPTVKLEYGHDPSGAARCLLTANEPASDGRAPGEVKVDLCEVADELALGRPVIPRLLRRLGFREAADLANARGAAQLTQLAACRIHEYRIFFRYDLDPTGAVDGVEAGPPGAAIRITPPKSAADRSPRWFAVQDPVIAQAVRGGQSLLEAALIADPELLLFLSRAIPAVERAVLRARTPLGPKAPSRSI